MPAQAHWPPETNSDEPHCLLPSDGAHLPFLEIFQRWDDNPGVSSVGTMDCLAVVPQSLLREAFRVAELLRTLRPNWQPGFAK